MTAEEATTTFFLVSLSGLASLGLAERLASMFFFEWRLFSIYISGYHDYQEPVSIWMLLTFLYFVNEKLSNNVQRNKIHKRVENVK